LGIYGITRLLYDWWNDDRIQIFLVKLTVRLGISEELLKTPHQILVSLQLIQELCSLDFTMAEILKEIKLIGDMSGKVSNTHGGEKRREPDETLVGPIDLPETGANFKVDESVEAGKTIVAINAGLSDSPWSTFSPPISGSKVIEALYCGNSLWGTR
jgi:hypothetical protein